MQQTQQGFDQESGFIEPEAIEAMEAVEMPLEEPVENDRAKTRLNMEARRKIEQLREEKALRKLLEQTRRL